MHVGLPYHILIQSYIMRISTQFKRQAISHAVRDKDTNTQPASTLLQITQQQHLSPKNALRGSPPFSPFLISNTLASSCPESGPCGAISHHPSLPDWPLFGGSPLPSSVYMVRDTSYSAYSSASTGQESRVRSHWQQGLSPQRNSGFGDHPKCSIPRGI